jgi:thiol-disulfide isomerase/thioredoxin
MAIKYTHYEYAKIDEIISLNMKNILLLLISFCVFACNSHHPNDNQNDRIIIAGKVYEYDQLNPIISITPNRIAVKRDGIDVVLDEDGTFNASFKSSIPIDFFVGYKTNFLVLAHPGDSIYVEFNGAAKDRPLLLESIKFSGDFADQNQDAAAFQRMYFSNNFYPNYEKRRLLMKLYEPISFKTYMDSCRLELYDLLNQFNEEYKPTKEVKIWARTKIDVDYYRDLLSYPDKHMLDNKLTYKEWAVPFSYFDFMKEHFEIDESVLISGYSIYGFVDFYAIYINDIIRRENQNFFNSPDSIKKYPEIMDSIRFFGRINNTKNSLLRQMVLTEMLYEGLEFSKVEIIDRYADKIAEIIREPYLKDPLFAEYNKTKDRLNNPKLASDVFLNKLKGSSVKMAMDSIITLNRGKVIYIDCWATWCGPCLSEMPNSKSLMDEFKTKNVAFIFICLDSDEKSWKAALSKLSLKGQHYYLSKEQSTDFKSLFEINGIPHYILIDKAGAISENRTLRPSMIKDKLDNLLKQ